MPSFIVFGWHAEALHELFTLLTNLIFTQIHEVYGETVVSW
jgi:hypothetical protein